MSYYSTYEGYKPSFYESDNDDVPMISQGSYAPPRCHQDNWNLPYQSRSWNDEPLEMEQPEMSNLERLLKEAIEQTERHSREFDEIFDWNFEPYHEKPYDTFTNAIEHLDDVEAIEYNAYYSNDYAAGSSNIVFQDDSEEEMDEEEEKNKVTNYPHEVSQSVLQNSHSLEPEGTEKSDLKDLDYEDSEFEDSDFEGSIEEEVEEILVMPDLEAAESAAASSILEEHEPNVSYPDSHAIVDYDADIKELQELLGISDHELDKLVKKGVGDDLILEAEFENLYRASGTQVQTEIGGGDLDDPSIKESKSDFMSHSLPYNCECILLIEPKPPGYLFVESVFRGGIVESNIVHGQLNKLLEVDRLAMLERSIECVHLNYFEEPPDCFCILVKGFSEDVGITSHSYLKVALIKIIIRPLKEWRVYIHVISFSWRMFYRNDKTKEDILQCEYDEKGGGSVIEDWL